MTDQKKGYSILYTISHGRGAVLVTWFNRSAPAFDVHPDEMLWFADETEAAKFILARGEVMDAPTPDPD